MASEHRTRPSHRPHLTLALATLWLGALACNSGGGPPPATATAKASGTPPAGGDQSARNTGDDRTLGLREGAVGKNPIKTAKVQNTRLSSDVDLVGSVAASQNHLAIVGPLVSGRVSRLSVGVGDFVKRGHVLAEVESAEVGQAKAEYLTARARLHASEANLNRENDLASRRISSEREREVAVAQAETERANLKAAIERLRSIGLSAHDINSLARDRDTAGRVPIRAPIEGTIISRPVTLGQAVERATDAFKIADLRTLWVLLDLYEKDLAKVFVGQKVELLTEAYRGEIFKAKVAYIEPVIDEETRTAKVRIEFENPHGKLRLGQLVTAHIIGDPKHATVDVLAVPRSAVQRVEGKPVVFLKNPNGFSRRVVEIGGSGGELIEIRQGLVAGEEVATDGAFLLKSEFLR